MTKKNPHVGSSFDEFLREEAASVNLNDEMKCIAAVARNKVERRADRLIAEETARTARAAELGAEDCVLAPPVESLAPHDDDGEALLAAYEHHELKPLENQGVAKRAAIRAAKRHRAKGRKRTSTTAREADQGR